jgi:hypothetical protein
MMFDDLDDLSRDIIHGLITIHRDQSAGLLVIVRYRARLLLESRESWLNYFQPVIIAGYQLRSMRFVADFVETGRLEVDIIDPSTGGTRTSSSNPEQQLIIVDHEPDHNWPCFRGTRIVKELVLE